MDNRARLRAAAIQIAANKSESPARPVIALRKLLIQERRDWTQPGAPRVGWKRGELFEVAEALATGGDVAGEWGDVGYYVAQSRAWLWWLYAAVTPGHVIERAAVKFEGRASP